MELCENNYRIDICSALRNKTSKQDFLNQLIPLVKMLGFSDVDIALAAGYRGIDFVLNSLPKPMLESYTTEKLYETDLILEYLINAKGPVFEAKAYDFIASTPFYSPRFTESVKAHELMKEHGFDDSYTIPVTVPLAADSEIKLLFTVLKEHSNAEDFQRHVKDKANKINQLAKIACNLIVQNIISQLPKTNKSLTARQLQILDAVAKEKGFQQVANRFDISIRTVQKHMEEIKDKLGAHSIPNAVYVALERGLLKFGP